MQKAFSPLQLDLLNFQLSEVLFCTFDEISAKNLKNLDVTSHSKCLSYVFALFGMH